MTKTTKTTGRVANRFTKGTALYACNCCGRQTRDTGRGDNEGVKLCVQCYELAGYENMWQDQREFSAADKSAINQYLHELSTYIGPKAYELHAELVSAITKADNKGINPEKAPKAVLKEVAIAEPSRVREAQKPSAVKKVKPNLKARAKAVVKPPKAKAVKAPAAPELPKYEGWMVWEGDTVIDVVFSTPMTTAEAQKHYTMKYTVPVIVTNMEDGRKRNDYLKTLKKGRAKSAKPASEKAPRAPRATVADDTLYHVAPVAEGKPARRGQTAINMAVLEKLKTFTRAQAIEALTPSVGLVEAKSVWADGKNRSIIVVAPVFKGPEVLNGKKPGKKATKK